MRELKRARSRRNPLRRRRGGQTLGSVGDEPERRAGRDSADRNVGEDAPQRENALLLPIARHEAGGRCAPHGGDRVASRLVDAAKKRLLPMPFEARKADNLPLAQTERRAAADKTAGDAHRLICNARLALDLVMDH